jgi:hypothetical protein
MAILAAFTLNWFIQTRSVELTESASGSVTVSETGVLIDLTGDGDKEAEYDGVQYLKGSTRLRDGRLRLPPPRIAAMLSPPSYFWSFIFLIFTLGMGGWAWTLSDKIVGLTMAGEKKIHFLANRPDVPIHLDPGCHGSGWCCSDSLSDHIYCPVSDPLFCVSAECCCAHGSAVQLSRVAA